MCKSRPPGHIPSVFKPRPPGHAHPCSSHAPPRFFLCPPQRYGVARDRSRTRSASDHDPRDTEEARITYPGEAPRDTSPSRVGGGGGGGEGLWPSPAPSAEGKPNPPQRTGRGGVPPRPHPRRKEGRIDPPTPCRTGRGGTPPDSNRSGAATAARPRAAGETAAPVSARTARRIFIFILFFIFILLF